MEHFELLVVGGGAAGMAAALRADERGMSVLLAERADRLGGILPQCIHSGFGLGYFGEDLTGPEYAARFIEKIEKSRVKVLLDTMVLRLGEDKTALLSGSRGLCEFSFDRCILAAGCRERPIGALPVHGARPAGIFTAGAAQKMVNIGHYDIGSRIVILGSGDIGQIMARRFTLMGKNVVAVVEKEPQLGGLARNRRNCIEAYNIPVILNATVEQVLGSGRINGVIIRDLPSGECRRLDCDTLVTAVGLIPERELADNIGEPQWLNFCGNCDHIHEIVDAATMQAEKTVDGF